MCFHKLVRVACKAVFISTRDEDPMRPPHHEMVLPPFYRGGEGEFLDRLIKVHIVFILKRMVI